MNCPLCQPENEDVLLQTERYRIIAVHNEAGAPAFCRVIWQQHAAEMTDLDENSRNQLMNAVYRTEAAMRQVLRPAKINLASLGNVVPHLHWHVIARFSDDSRFPAPIWAAAQRQSEPKLPENWQLEVRRILQSQQPEN